MAERHLDTQDGDKKEGERLMSVVAKCECQTPSTMQGLKTGETVNQTYHRQYLHHPDGRIVWAHPTGTG